MDAYCRFTLTTLRESTSQNARCVRYDYASLLHSASVVNYASLVRYRYNTINWASDFYRAHELSTSTTVTFIELFDKYVSFSAMKNEHLKLKTTFSDDTLMVMLSVVLTKLAMEYNEDRNFRLTSADVNRLAGGANRRGQVENEANRRLVTRDQFMECERDVLNTVEFRLWDAQSMKATFEMFVSIISSMFGYANVKERAVFPYYCRYVYDVLQLDYEVLASQGASAFLACCLYLSKLHWPTNYLQVLLCNDATVEACYDASRQTTPPPHCTTPAWFSTICDAFEINPMDLNIACERLMQMVARNSGGHYYKASQIARRYDSVEVGCANRIGMPSLEFFVTHRIQA